MNSQTLLINRLTPGTFVELDNLMGGRKISLVCPDGLTSIDSTAVGFSTPFLIHKKFKPLALGSISHFVLNHHLDDAYSRLVSVLRRKEMENESTDCLFIIRALDFLRLNSEKELTLPLIDAAIDSSRSQQQMLNDLQQIIVNYLRSAQENMVN